MDAHLVCTRYQFKFAICQSTMLPRSDQEDMFIILFYFFPVCGTFSPLLLCHRWGGWISYKVISLRYTPVLGSEGAPLSLFLERGRGGGGGEMSVRVKSCNGVTVISKVSNQRWKCIKFNPLFFAGHNWLFWFFSYWDSNASSWIISFSPAIIDYSGLSPIEIQMHQVHSPIVGWA